tara:strand:- start:3 stop:11099 length:11097 start_codon:yes stop_codon:yes gene_type:complete
MSDTKVKVSHLLESQIPDFIQGDNPLFKEFLEQYYISEEHEYGTIDLAENVADNKNIKSFSALNTVVLQTLNPIKLTSAILASSRTIDVTNTGGFPNSYGIIKIDNEIITYTGKTATSFTGCVRGFSGISSLEKNNNPEYLTFSTTEADEHASEAVVSNLSHLFLLKFYEKFKAQYLPGVEKRDLHPTVSVDNVLSRAKDFYISKGTNTSLEILFKVLFGKNVEIVKPFNNTITSSDANWIVADQIIVEALEGNPVNLKETTLFESSFTSPTATGAISNVEEIFLGNKKYYKISMSHGTMSHEFKVNNKTKVIGTASTSSVVTVDSTIGFGTSGSFLYQNTLGVYTSASYTSKSHNQFFGCSINTTLSESTSIIDDNFVYGWENNDSTKVCKMRPVGVVNGANPSDISKTKYFTKGDDLNLKHLGDKVPYSEKRSNNWFHNNVTYTDVKVISGSNIETKDKHFLKKFDRVDFIRKDNRQLIHSDVEIKNIINDNNFTIGAGFSFSTLDYVVKRRLSFSSTNLGVEELISGIQNTFVDSEGNSYVAFSGYPSDSAIQTTDRSVTFESNEVVGSTININSHQFLNGEKIHYQPLTNDSKVTGITTGTYYVNVVDVNNIRLSLNPQNLYLGNTIAISGSGTDTHKITPSIPVGDADRVLKNQDNFRRIYKTPKNNEDNTNIIGPIGVGLDGVELHSPISNDSVYYGQLNKIIVLDGGSNYSVTSPPNVAIADSYGSSAVANAQIGDGSIHEIVLRTRGFDYIATPSVSITGGNGSGAECQAKMQGYDHSVSFNDFKVDLTLNKITLDDNHKFLQGEEVTYTATGTPIGVGATNIGITTTLLSSGGTYYISQYPGDTTAFRIYSTKEKALVGAASSAIDFLAYGNGTHTFKSTKGRNIIADITILNSGHGYSNNKVLVDSQQYPPADRKDIFKTFVGIDTHNNSIYAKKHNFKNSDKIKYSTSNSVIGGLTDTSNYIVTVLDENNFRLSNSITDYGNKVYVDLTSIGSGTHTFNYPDITVNISGPVGLGSTVLPSYYTATAEALVKGKIDNIFLKSGGVGYGVTNIVNFIRKPIVSLVTGKDAELQPIVSATGEIEDVAILNGGSEYTTAPILSINGKGRFGKIRANVTNGIITSVEVINKGRGYVGITSAISPTSITVTPFGSKCSLSAEIYQWQFNNVQRYDWLLTGTNKDLYKDTVQISSELKSKGNKICSFYAPKQVRKILGDNLNSSTFAELDVSEPGAAHSPIIGWAYDGNPIYGSVGNAKPIPDSSGTGGIKRLKSSYELNPIVSVDLRPSSFGSGDFIQDYVYNGKGDLDEFNGRYIVNSDFPKGTYAYFTPVDSSGATPSWDPVFPYLTFKHRNATDSFNYSIFNNQSDKVINSGVYTRNITPLGLNEPYRDYPFLSDSLQSKVSLQINGSKQSGITSISVLSSGELYNVGDNINFPTGSNISASVSEVLGKTVISVGTSEIVQSKLAFGFKDSTVTAFSTVPHDYINGDIIEISGISSSLYKNIEGDRIIGVTTVTSKLSVAIGSTTATGINTSIRMYDTTVSDKFAVDDIIKIGNEEMLITSKDVWNNKYNVIRKYNGVQSAHNVDTEVVVRPKIFTFNVDQKLENKNLQTKKVRYLDASTITYNGIPYQSSVGIGSTANNIIVGYAGSNPIINSSDPRSIYLPGHQFNTGDRLKLIPDPNGGFIKTSNVAALTGVYNLSSKNPLYCIKLSNDYIGISTTKAGVVTSTLVYFTNATTGSRHRFETIVDEVTGNSTKTLATAILNGQHSLKSGDNFNLKITPSKTQNYKAKYNNITNRLTVDEKSFAHSVVSAGATISEIKITNHGFETGDVVVYNGSVPADLLDPLVNNGVYHVIKLSDDVIKLASNSYDSKQAFPYNFIGFTSTGTGTHKLEKIHPKLTFYRGNTVAIGVSDPSLNDYIINFYTDNTYRSRFISAGITTEGSFGDSNPDSKISISVDDSFPSELYYRVEGVDGNYTNTYPSSIYTETTIEPKIEIVESKFNKKHKIAGVASTTVNFVIAGTAETTSYSGTGFSTAFYHSDSTSISGGIYKVKVFDGGKLNVLPIITSIASTTGSGAVLTVESEDVGEITGLDVVDQGLELTNNKTLAPQADSYTILKLKDTYTLKGIGVSTAGQNYTIAPRVVAIGNSTLSTKTTLLGNSVDKVEIITNDSGFADTLKIIPTVNSNGVGVVEATSATVTGNQVNTLRLRAPVVGFNTANPFPFAISDEIFVENVKILSSTGDGYNSSDFNYKYFTVTGINTIAGTESISYNITGIGSTGGTYDPVNNFGRVVKKTDLATFTPDFERVTFIEGEKITQGSSSGIVAQKGWDPDSQILKLKNVRGDFIPNVQIIGSAARIKSTVETTYEFDVNLTVGAIAHKDINWETDKGKLNLDSQRLHDNDYYQRFSYAIKGQVPYQTWKEPIGSLAHISGYKKFADYEVATTENVGIITANTFVEIDVSVDNEASVWNDTQYDFATEDTTTRELSKIISFDSSIITDYNESVTNKVLMLDDISDQFTGKTSTFTGTHIFVRDELALTTGAITKVSTGAGLAATTGTAYNPQSGILTIVTTTNHGLNTGDKITIADKTLTFTCDKDAHQTEHLYPRSTDPASTSNAALSNGKLPITKTNATTFTVDVRGYSAIVGGQIVGMTTFSLYSGGETAFIKAFNPATGINTSNNQEITINDHEFHTGERLHYSGVGNTAIGIVTTNVAGIGNTNILPLNVYPIRLTKDKIKVAISTSNAAASIGVTFTNVTGVGTNHTLAVETEAATNRSMISIDNMIQSPIARKILPVGLSTNVGIGTTVIRVVDPSSIEGKSLLKIGDEIIKVNLVGVGATNTLNVIRGFMGTVAAAHTVGASVTALSGDYRIDNGKIHFSEAPYGPAGIGTLVTTSSFSGRLFYRLKYDNNFIFDDISEQFTGIGQTYNLTSNGQTVTGIAGIKTSYGAVLINNIFQKPFYGDVGSISKSDYQIVGAGETITFTGSFNNEGNVSVGDSTNYPKGGRINEFDVTTGKNFQAPYGAVANITVSAAGTITSVGLVTGGQGYIRTPRVSIGTTDRHFDHTFIGSANNSVNVTSGPQLTPTGADYNSQTGVLTLTINGHGLTTANTVSIDNNSLTFRCSRDNYATDHTYPRTTDPVAGIATNITAYTDNTITLNIGVGGGIDAVVTASVTAGIVTALTLSNPGTGYTTADLPTITIDPPHPYKDLALTGGSGTGAAMDVVVGTGGSVIAFDMTNRGKGYSVGDILSLDQLPYTAGVSTLPFTVTITSRYQDKFAGWSFGHLLELDDFSNLFNDYRKSFLFTRTTNEKDYYSIVAREGSGITLANNLFIFINDVLQRPNIDYEFTGGTRINFLEAPRAGSSCKMYLYVGSDDDFIAIDVDQTIKPGDVLRLQPWDNVSGQDPRIVYELISADTVETQTYSGVGIITDSTVKRPVDWRKQTEDVIIDGARITKNRNYLTAQFYPTSHIIKSVSATDTKLYLENTYPIFKDIDDTSGTRNNIRIVGLGTTAVTEDIQNVTYTGDYGIIVGIGTSATGIGSTACGSLILDLKPHSNIINLSGKGRSGITTGDYFVLKDSIIGTGVTSLGINTSTTVAIGTAFIDNVFYANHYVSVGSSILRVYTNVKDVSGIITSTLPSSVERYASYSWGAIDVTRTTSSHAFEFFNRNGTVGIETSAHVSRISQLRSSY